MQQLLNAALAERRGRVIDPTFIYIRDLVNKNMDRVLTRNYASSKFVRPEHLLIKLLFGLGINRTMSYEELLYSTTDRMYSIANSMGLTAATSVGKSHSKVTLDAGEEFVLLYSEDFEPTDNWNKLQPVKFLYHNQTNINCRVGGENDEDAFAIIAVNVPMLAYQYVRWVQYVKNNKLSENVYQFMAKYPLMNAVYSYMDISLFNLYYYRLVGEIIPDEHKHPELSLTDVHSPLTKSNLNILNKITIASHTVTDVLWNTPLFFSDTALQLLKDVPTANTRQCRWLLFCYKLPYIRYGLVASASSGAPLDSGKISSLKRELDNLKNTSVLSQLPTQSSLHIIGNILDPLYETIAEVA